MIKSNLCHKVALLRDNGILTRVIDWIRYEVLKCYEEPTQQIIQAKASQTAHMVDWQNSSAKVIYSISEEDHKKLSIHGSLEKLLKHEIARARQKDIEMIEGMLHTKENIDFGSAKTIRGVNYYKFDKGVKEVLNTLKQKKL